MKKSLPVQWKTGGKVVGRTDAKIARPSAQELKVYSSPRAKTCGQCKNFRRSYFQQMREKFTDLLVNEYEWKIFNLGQDPKTMGRCMMDAELLVGPHSGACEQFKCK